jgi:hypothetical protein
MTIEHLWQVTQQFSLSVVRGVKSTLHTLGEGADRIGKDIDVFHFEQWKQNWEQQIRVFDEGKKAILVLFKQGYHGPLLQMIEQVMMFYHHDKNHKPNQTVGHAINDSGYAYGHYILSKRALITMANVIAHRIYSKIIKDAEKNKITRYLSYTGILLSGILLEGTIDKAIKSAQRLKSTCPRLYFKLRQSNVEMLYFLIEKPMHTYIKSICQPANRLKSQGVKK